MLFIKKVPRKKDKIIRDIRSAGQSFLGLHMADLLTRTKELDDRVLKNKLVEEYFNKQEGFSDKYPDGTRTRINSAIRIIKAEEVIYALEQINGDNPMVLPEVVESAKETIKKIKNAQLTLRTL